MPAATTGRHCRLLRADRHGTGANLRRPPVLGRSMGGPRPSVRAGAEGNRTSNGRSREAGRSEAGVHYSAPAGVGAPVADHVLPQPAKAVRVTAAPYRRFLRGPLRLSSDIRG